MTDERRAVETAVEDVKSSEQADVAVASTVAENAEPIIDAAEVKPAEDAVQEEVDEEDSITYDEFMEQQKVLNEEARILLGGQDDTVCTFPEGYKPRQPVYACLTCAPNGEAGICYGCSLHCHEGHNVEELFTKRRFRCDCGTGKIEGKCTLYDEEKGENGKNVYNHNFVGRYCKCDKIYPDPEATEQEVMRQCLVCEDWFHVQHLGIEDFDGQMVCDECSAKVPFLLRVKMGDEQVPEGCTVENPRKDGEVAAAFFVRAGWRDLMCKCSKCEGLYDKYGCDWILDEEDSLEKYEQDAVEKTKEEDVEMDDRELVREVVKKTGPEGAVAVFREVNHMKRKLAQFLNSFQGGVLKESDVKGFFSELKKARIEQFEREGHDESGPSA